ncbi:MAG TPA: anti-sigma factor [Candidatus Binatia bacterium]
MTEPKPPILESELHAYVDRQLANPRDAEVENYLAANPEEGQKVRFYREINETLHKLFDPVLNEPVPLSLLSPRVGSASRPRQLAGIVLALAVGAVAGWSGRGFYASRPFNEFDWARNAAMAHLVYSPERRHAVEVAAAEEQHLVTWLSRRLGSPLKVPHLTKEGYDLVGGRLLPGDQGPVAHFMYQDANGQRLTLYVRTDIRGNPTTAFRFYEQGQVRVFYWLDGQLGYALSGEVKKDELLRLAGAIYHELTK